MLKKILSVFMCLTLLLSAAAVLAEEVPVPQEIVDKTIAIPVFSAENAKQTLTDIEITGPEAPVPDEELSEEAGADDKAQAEEAQSMDHGALPENP